MSVNQRLGGSQVTRGVSRFGQRKSLAPSMIIAETLREKQVRAKEERELRRVRLRSEHGFIFNYISCYLNLDLHAVEEFILDSCEHLNYLEAFFKGESKSIKVYYQEADVLLVEECGRVIPGTVKGGKYMRLFMTDGCGPALTGICLYFLRTRVDVAINMKNISEEIFFGVLDARQGLLNGMNRVLKNVYRPQLHAMHGGWNIDKDVIFSERMKKTFLNDFDNFVEYVDVTQNSLDGTVHLADSSHLNVGDLHTPVDCAHASHSSETVRKMEELVLTWCKQIERVIIESDRIRREADNTGPMAEIEHWKLLQARFGSVLQHNQGHKCKMVICTLQNAKSRVIKKWVDLDKRVTNAANEAKDNVKYLSTLEKVCLPLYRCDPVSMINSIPNLINAIRMVYNVSLYYNTPEKMTSIFRKVTNQMVKACKSYVTEEGTKMIWDEERGPLMEKLKSCTRLHTEYKDAFRRVTKRNQQSPEERSFEFSEMYIFGKFDAFCKRIDKLVYLFNTMEKYSVIGASNIEGVEPLVVRFSNIIQQMKKKPYDMMDHRNKDFDDDFEEFKRCIGELEVQIQNFLDNNFEKITDIGSAVSLLNKFENLGIIDDYQIRNKYKSILVYYGQELERMRDLYDKQKSDVPTYRDMPPVAGKIAWARHLYRRIRDPMDIFEKHPTLLKSKKAKPIIKMFNRFATTLIEFETLYYRAWVKQVDNVMSSLFVPIFIRHPETLELFVNFDPMLLETMREADALVKMDLELPDAVKMLFYNRERFKMYSEKLEYLLQRDCCIREMIPQLYTGAMKPSLEKLDSIFRPGVLSLTWASLGLTNFFESAEKELDDVEFHIRQVSSLKESHIDGTLENMTLTILCPLPEIGTTWSLDEFLQNAITNCSKCGKSLDFKSQKVEDTVVRILRMFMNKAGVVIGPDYDWRGRTRSKDQLNEKAEVVREECVELLNLYSQKNLDALVKATRTSLDTVRKRMFLASKTRTLDSQDRSEQKNYPIFKTDIVLEIPNVVMKPSLEDIQHTLTKVTHNVIEVSQHIALWGQDRYLVQKLPVALESGLSTVHFAGTDDVSEISPTNLKNYYRSVADHKDVTKYILALSAAIPSCREFVQKELSVYSKYSFLWEDDREETVSQFLKRNPTLSEFREEIVKYEEYIEEIKDIPEGIAVGPIWMQTEKLKLALKVEIKSWQMVYAKHLNEKFRRQLHSIFEFIDEEARQLGRPIKDLEDVRQTMASLERVRHRHIEIDVSQSQIEEAYAMLSAFGVEMASDESNKVDGLSYAFTKLLQVASDLQDTLVKIQPGFKQELFESVAAFEIKLDKFVKDYEQEGPMEDGIHPDEASDRLTVFQSKFDELWRNFETYSAGQELFGLEVKDYPALQKIRKQLVLLHKLYSLYDAVMTSINGYYDLLWTDVDIAKINTDLVEFQNRCRKLPKGLKEWRAFLDLKKKIDDFNETCPLLEHMANNAMKERHWSRLAEITGHSFDINSETFSLKHIMEAPLLEFKDEIEDTCIAAMKERDIEAKLKQVTIDWTAQVFSFSQFKTRGELLLKGNETMDIVANVEDSLMILSSLVSNRYNAPFKKSIQDWVNKLSNTAEIIDNWLTVQNLWIYLEAVFVGGDIAKQLPKEAKRFSNIDKSWIKIMIKAREMPNVITCCTGDETLGHLLPHLLEQLELCQKSLTGYLEAKRKIFPRFFFVSDPALLEILGQASDSHTIQSHLAGIFDNLNSVTFHQKDYDRIISVSSREGETIKLEDTVNARGNVECWLGELLTKQRKALHIIIREVAVQISLDDFDLLSFLQHSIAQISLLTLQIIWTRDSEHALLHTRYDKKIMPITNQRFLDWLNMLINQTTMDLSKFERLKFETLITIHVHQRDIFEDLCKMHVRSLTDFEWLKQSRFYFREDADTCTVSITDVDFVYQNEFLGNTDRLVITPLTDRCYITLAQALGMSMGGAPAGPAGTGKTETTKDMGKALGKYVVVFNCSDQMDFRGLGRIFKGLAQSGSWGCFDEFNRIDLPVLSVAAQQIYIILSAKKERKKSFVFSDGDTVDLNPEFGLFITMNPGYAGRQELPENLKIQFRTVAMMVPDRQIIIRVKLASCGFVDNVILAQKFFTLYKLCEEQLSKQVHYDFGLRNILSVLRTLGAQKRLHSVESENTIVMRVLRDMNLSKLVDEDEPLFLSLVEDLFPGIKMEGAQHLDLQVALAHHMEEEGLTNHPPWNLKIFQLYETVLVRHGIMTLGPSGAGKTCCIHMLLKAFTTLGKPHREMRMNPKAITAAHMFGRLDVATNDWTDGIFSTLWRRCLKSKKNDHIWIVLDGPVDAVWIENLNSVLDDNKTLTLANGDRIPMAANSKVLFEVHNIDNASPATVSRNGMVFMSSSVLDWRPLVEGWLRRRIQRERDIFIPLFESCFDELYLFVEHSLNKKMKVYQCNIIAQACNIVGGLIPLTDELHAQSLTIETHEKIFVFALMWSLGALVELDDRAKMESFMLKNFPHLPFPDIQPNETLFEYMVNTNGEWEHWSQRVEQYVYPTDSIPEFSSILVPNVDNVRTTFLIETIAHQERCVLLIGEQGTAKTVMINGFMSQKNPEEHLVKVINFSSATSPLMFQKNIESYVDKRMGSTFGPPGGRKMTVFIDDINMPLINEWGDQVTNEITRQTIEMQGFYSLEKPGEFTNIVDIQYIAAMIHPGGGRNDIPERLKRQFSIFNCTIPSNNSIDSIFGTIGCGYFCPQRFSDEACNIISSLIGTTRIIWQKTKTKMLPTPAKFHYVFNLRDLSRIWEGMLQIKPQECSSEDQVLGLWKHECTRAIADRFVNFEDKQWFEATLRNVGSQILGDTCAAFLEDQTYFVNFMRDPPEFTGEEEIDDAMLEMPKVYEGIRDFEAVRDRLNHFMEQYNEQVRGTGMDMVFFKDCIINLVKVARILAIPRGAALLVGVGGSGKQSITRLASFIAGYLTFQITLSRSYNVANLLEDIKYMYRETGQHGKGLTFIFTDNEVKDESFLEYLNSVLSSGDISNLFARDELDEIIGELSHVMKAEKPRAPQSPEILYEYFISRVRRNLHIVLCFSPVGEKFRSRALKFPGLISGCTINWFQTWPCDALVAVSTYLLSSFEIVASASSKTQLTEMMGEVHDMVKGTCENYFERFRRQTYVTPKSYLSFLNGYKTIYNEKHAAISELATRMNMGLTKLLEASNSVDQLSKELVIKEKELEVANKKADEELKIVTLSAQAAEKVKLAVQKVKDKAQAIVDAIGVDKALAETKLEAAKPALEAAEAALLTIKPTHIATVKKLGKPPHLIMRIMDCVLILFQKKMDTVTADPERPCPKPSWGESLKLMGQSTFLNSLLNFPKDIINDETVELLAPYLEMEDYTLECAKKVCGDVAGLLSWTVAMSVFFGINKDVLPLKANLAIQQNRLEAATVELNAAQATLDEKEQDLARSKDQYDAAMLEKKRVSDGAMACRKKMNAATELITGLAGERERWTTVSQELMASIDRLVGDVLILTGFLSYAGPFNQEFRLGLLSSWEKTLKKRKIPYTPNLSIIEALVDNSIVCEWNIQGLPNNELSIQNGIIVTKATRYPLLIDPQAQGKTWIKNKEKDKELQVTSLNHKYFRNHLEDSLSLGRPLLIEDIEEEIDPILDNLLERNFIKSGTILKVQVGDKECDVMSGFFLYITTKLPNPAYTPEISARTSIIDFTVTMRGLEDQLLSRVTLAEKAELEAERTRLIEDVLNNKRKMKALEDNLLHKLTSTQGSLVDDESLIVVLHVTKATAADVSEKLLISAETETKINTARDEFRPVASRGSILYFLICDMSMVNCMYQTSLRQFLQLFDMSVNRSGRSPLASKRIMNIVDYLTKEVFRYSCRGLYETHKFLFTLLLTLRIDMDLGHVKPPEFQMLIKGGAALELHTVEPKPCKWILDMTWLNLVQLSRLNAFSDLLNQIPRNEKVWKQWYEKDAPEEEAIPDGYDNSLDPFRRLLLIRAWCADRVTSQARHYIASSLGKQYAKPVILNLEELVEESNCRTPLIGLLSMGSDPTNAIETLSKRLRLSCQAISMGQGQEIHARKLVNSLIVSGGWVLLQNCHLGLNFLEELFSVITETETIHEQFRVWITTEVHPNFSINLLQISIKFTNEPPQGVKAGLKRTYAGITQEFLDISNMCQWKPMLYAVSFLHSVLQERRKYGSLGWNIPYEFNYSDWLASVQFVHNHLDDLDIKRGVSWTTVRYMIAEVQYGGRVTDDFDKRLLNTFAKVWFGDHMFKENYAFYAGYSIPRLAKHEEVEEFIECLPSIDSPEVFGLHPNADITYQSNRAKDILDTIVNIQPKDSGVGIGETREAVVYRHAEDMLSKLPMDYVKHEVQDNLKKMGHLQPSNIFLRQEIDRMQRVIALVRATLTDLKLAIEGTIIMNENLRDALDNLYDARVPNIWKRVSWESSTIGFWFTDLIERNEQFYKWVFHGRPNVFWMTGFFNPQGFLTAMRQEMTRAHKGWALDTVTLCNDVLKVFKEDITVAPEEGVNFYGLFLDGAAWDRRNARLTEPLPKVLFVQIPVIHMYATSNQGGNKDQKMYQCPVYKKPQRTDLMFITCVSLKTLQNPDKWILRGVAALCDTK